VNLIRLIYLLVKESRESVQWMWRYRKSHSGRFETSSFHLLPVEESVQTTVQTHSESRTVLTYITYGIKSLDICLSYIYATQLSDL
jgi:hypothetical protein